MKSGSTIASFGSQISGQKRFGIGSWQPFRKYSGKMLITLVTDKRLHHDAELMPEHGSRIATDAG